MLKITRAEGSDSADTLKLQGKLLGAWIPELESACGGSRDGLDDLHLDLSDLTFVDAAGARFLAVLIRRGARVVSCSAFVAELLQLQRGS
jgi:hypothetical protein